MRQTFTEKHWSQQQLYCLLYTSDPESGFDQVTDILLDGKRIRQIGKVDDVSGIEQVIDASGMIAAPGLIEDV